MSDRFLHLSDLHFGGNTAAENQCSQLASDLHELECTRLDGLILSGDIATHSSPKEYAQAELFLKKLCGEFHLQPAYIVIVPGNHDLNWELAEEAYELMRRRDYTGPMDEQGNPDSSHAIDNGKYVEVLNPQTYRQRFRHFSAFYEAVKGEPYPLEYEEQALLYRFPAQNLLILGLSSAWQLDHHHTGRAGIHADALSRAIDRIRRDPAYAHCRKFAVWHHPLRNADGGFMQRLAGAGFQIALHGHIHKADSDLYRYDQSAEGRRIEIICAGTFGAPVQAWTPGNTLTVETRCRREPQGAWQADAIWTQGAGQDPLPRYTIDLESDPGIPFSPGRPIHEKPLGNLINVPGLPLHFLPRDLNTLKAKVLNVDSSDSQNKAEGIVRKIGIQGMGGIGKSVLAAALAQDEELRRKFPDGILWITLGQTPNLIARQMQLAQGLGDTDAQFTDTQAGKARLSALLAERACLIVLDDVWEMVHVAVFNALGKRSLLLFTTRNAELITFLGAEQFSPDLLTPAQAGRLLSACANRPELPAQAAAIIRECGCLPLALAMAGGMLRGRDEDWDELLELLRQADLTEIEQALPDYEHVNLFRALQASVTALEPEVRERYLDFAMVAKVGWILDNLSIIFPFVETIFEANLAFSTFA